jgi:hypothetical protein
VAEREWKYIYSTADRREWLFHLARDPGETRDLSRDHASRPHLARLRASICEQFERDGYDWAVERGQWREYPPPHFPADPRTGLLFQDPGELSQALTQLSGYSRTAPAAVDLLGATYPQKMDPATGEVRIPD